MSEKKMSDDYKCPKCNNPIGFGEAICPNCKADVTGVWENPEPKKKQPKVAPGTGGVGGASPFPPAGGGGASPFPPASGGASPFPPAKGGGASPFPSGGGGASPFPPANNTPPGTGATPGAGGEASPFPPPNAQPAASPFPPATAGGSKPFPPIGTAVQLQSGPHIDIPRIGAKIYIPDGDLTLGRREIQGAATKALPDLNAYNNLSRKHLSFNNRNR